MLSARRIAIVLAWVIGGVSPAVADYDVNESCTDYPKLKSPRLLPSLVQYKDGLKGTTGEKRPFVFEVAAKNYRLSRCIGLDEEQDFETRVTAWLTAAGIAGAIAKNYALSFWNDGQEIRNAFGRRIFPCLKAAVALKDKDGNASPAAVAKYAEIVTGMMNSNFKSRIEKNFQVNLKTEKDQALEMIRSTPNVPQSAKTKLTAAGN